MPLIGRRSDFPQRRNASAVRRDGAEQLHDEALERREGFAAGIVGTAFHGLLEPGARIRIAGVVGELEHDVVHRVAPLAERHEIVEHLEHDVLVREILAVAGVLDPVVGKVFSGFGVLPLVMSASLSSIHSFRKRGAERTVM